MFSKANLMLIAVILVALIAYGYAKPYIAKAIPQA